MSSPIPAFPHLEDIRHPGIVASAREVLGHGGCVVIPTDTVYGIAVDAMNSEAVHRLHLVKGRSPDTPAPVLVADTDCAWELARHVSPLAKRLGAQFWPGPLTLILPRPSATLTWAQKRGSIGVRVPAHEPLRALLRAWGPLAVSSANRHDRIAATTVEQAWEHFGDEVDLYLDAGPTPGPVPSTVVDCTSTEAVILRRGVLSKEQLAIGDGAANA